MPRASPLGILPLLAFSLGGAGEPRGCVAPEAVQAEPAVEARADVLPVQPEPAVQARPDVIILRSPRIPCDVERVTTWSLTPPELLEAATPESARILACLTRASQGMSPPTLDGALDGLAVACAEPGAALEPTGVGHEYCGTLDVHTFIYGMRLNGREVFSWTGMKSWECPAPATGQR